MGAHVPDDGPKYSGVGPGALRKMYRYSLQQGPNEKNNAVRKLWSEGFLPKSVLKVLSHRKDLGDRVLAAPWRMGTATVGIMEVRLAFATRNYLAAFAGFESEHLSDIRSVSFNQPPSQ